jgi:DNA mismatch repair ATPase MutL
MTDLEKLFKFIQDVPSVQQSLAKRHSELDRAVSDCLHILELCSLDAVNTTKVMKKLKTLLGERREVKATLSCYSSLLQRNEKSMKAIQRIISEHTESPGKWKFECQNTKTYKEIFEDRDENTVIVGQQ